MVWRIRILSGPAVRERKEESKESKKEKKRKRRESEAMDVDPEEKVCCSMLSGSVCDGPDRLSCAATGGDGGGAQSAKEGKEGRTLRVHLLG